MKNQFKKSLSLVMAILMLMSCWVWVAPEKAEAGVATQYYMKITTNVTDTGDENGSTITINYKDTNGKGDTGTFTQSYGQQSWDGQVTVYEGPINGWPTSFSWKFDLGGGRTENHRDITVWIGGSAETCTHQIAYSTGYNFVNDLTGTDYLNCTMNITGTAPYFNEVTSIEAGSATLNKLPSGADVSTTVKVTGGKDQYGVVWKAALPTSGYSYAFKYTNASGSEVSLGSSYVSTSSTGNSATVYLKSALQKLFPGAANGQIQAYCTYNNTTAGATIKADFPTYKATFDSNGGFIGDDSSSAKTQVEVTHDKMHYDSVIGKQPAYASKDGFDFMGFYSTKNADATGKTASFSGTKFENGVTKVPDTGDTTWYAAWHSKPVTATFLTADNQLIGTVEGRYNNYLTASNMYGANLNATVKAAYTGNGIQFDSNNAPIYKDGATTYTFAGWKIIKAYSEDVVDKDEDTVLKGDVTFQATYTKADAATYTVSFEDGNGNILSTKSGYKYRDAVTNIPATEPAKAQDNRYDYEFIGWAKDIGKNFYVVDETDRDENGATVVYTHKDGASFVVKGDASYVPVFRMIPREYKVTYNYTGDNKTPMSAVIEGYHWHDGVQMPEGIKNNYTSDGFRYYIDGWQVNGAGDAKQLEDIIIEGDMTLTAHYGEGIPAEYTINFYGKAEDGVTDVLLNGDSNIYTHNSEVKAPEVDQTIETEDARYTFAGWSPSVSSTATGDVDYFATYTKQTYADLQFFNYNETELTNVITGNFVGETIPADAYSETPVKPEDPTGTYTFIGWNTKFDGSGKTVVLGKDVFEGDTKLYAQYETNYKDYTVKFLNDDGTVISEKTYHYSAGIEIPEAPTKAADETYNYEFKSWSPEVSQVCYGDATYTATYRRSYNYYKVTWFNDTRTTVHSSSNYTYGAKINQGIISDPVSYAPAGAGKEWAFKHWVQCDADGKDILDENGAQIIFARGMKMPAKALYFYPVFELASDVLSVTFYKEDGTTKIGTAKIPYGEDIGNFDDDFAALAIKPATEEYHFIIDKWINVDDNQPVTVITEDIAVKATYTQEAHRKTVEEVLAESTCNVHGYAHYYCEADSCDKADYYIELPFAVDNTAPTGQIYVGTRRWASDAVIDYTDITYISPNTQLIANTHDEGTPSRGVGKVEYYVAEGGPVENVSNITDWVEFYNYEELKAETLAEVLKEERLSMDDYVAYSSEDAQGEDKLIKADIDRKVEVKLTAYKANATAVASNLQLVNGQEYVIYIRVSDTDPDGRAARYTSNTTIYSSGTVSYGTEAAEVVISGEGFGTKFCAEADIRITDDSGDFKVYLDDEELDYEVTSTSADGTVIVNIETAAKGVHTLTVIDKHGNKTVKTFEIKGNHTYRNYTTAATCTKEGSRYDLCTVCGHKDNEEVLSALGHSYTVNFTDKAATCVVDGYRTYVCDNNCGTKLVLKPTDTAETIAQAKKYDAATESWVELTAADLKELKATGEHTYAKVKDENGEDTTEDAWVIDKAATCKKEGSKHKDCTVCGARVTETIPADTVNGHKFYRETVLSEPLCQEIGKKGKICRYCGYEVTTSYIDALGHVAGEYVILAAPTCTEAGKAMLTCSVCDCYIGEGEYDPMKEPVAKNLDPLGHAWEIDGAVYSEEVTDGTGETITVYYQNYKCATCGEIDKRKLDGYKPPVSATVTFMNGEDDAAPQIFSKVVGESIIATAVTEPTKAEDATYTYSFSHWADEDGNAVKFPIEVKGDATYYAVYTEKYINYTITYYKEDGITEYKKVGYLHNGDKVTLVDGPAKAETNVEKYTFAGWQLKDSDPAVVYGEDVTINGENIKLVATYTADTKKYAVTYAYTRDNIIHTYVVDAESEAPDVTSDFGEITKEPDANKHYEFRGWNKAEDLKSVVNNVYTTPEFDGIDHNFAVTTKVAATCTSNRVDTYTCRDENCGYSYDKEIPNSALAHDWSEPSYDEETGKTTVTCQREGCGVTEENTETYTVKFFVNETDTKAYDTFYYVPWGSKLTRIPSAPSKSSTETTEYKFSGWAVKGDEDETIVDIEALEIRDNYEFVAVFEEITIEYTVIFAYDAFNKIQTVTNVPADADVISQYTGATPTKASDASGHYEFTGWSVAAPDNLVIYVTAQFKKHSHSTTNVSELKDATCTTGKGTRYWCDCNGNGKFDDKVNDAFVDYYYDETGKPLGHNYKVTNRVEATPDADGYIDYKCEICGATKRDPIKYEDNKISIQVKVTHNGAAQAGVQVEILEKSATATSMFVTTNKDGIANAIGIKDTDYAAYVTINGEKKEVELKADANGNLSATYNYTDKSADCSCACHRDNIWGTIFRLFHKIIKFFTGEFKCCGNPDPMYG